MQITDIKIRKFFTDDGPMKAVISVTFDNQFAVHDIKIIYANDRYFIVMPSRKNADGTYRDIAHPINTEFRASLENMILERYKEEAETAATKQAEETAE